MVKRKEISRKSLEYDNRSLRSVAFSVIVEGGQGKQQLKELAHV